MKYSTLNQVQIFKHYGAHFASNSNAQLIYRGSIYCIVILLE